MPDLLQSLAVSCLEVRLSVVRRRSRPASAGLDSDASAQPLRATEQIELSYCFVGSRRWCSQEESNPQPTDP